MMSNLQSRTRRHAVLSSAMFLHDKHRHSLSCAALVSDQNAVQILWTSFGVKPLTHAFFLQWHAPFTSASKHKQQQYFYRKPQ